MARWGEGSRGEGERGRWGDERNAGRWRGGEEGYGEVSRENEGGWLGRGEESRDDWRMRERDDWRGGEWRGRERDDWREREGRWERLHPGEHRTYSPGKLGGRGELYGRGEYRTWESERGEREPERFGMGRGEPGGRWRGEEEYGGMGGGGRDQGGVMGGGAYGYGAYGYGARGYGAGGYGARPTGEEWGMGREDWREREFRGEGGGMMDRLKEGVRKMTGRGPKGYRRSDERIREEVSERIARSWVDAEDVEVRVANGDVTLSGTVVRREDKRELEDIAEDVYGVDDVKNELRVRREGRQAMGTEESQARTTQPAQGAGQRIPPGTTQPGARTH